MVLRFRHADKKVRRERSRNLCAEKLPDARAADAPNDLADQVAKGERMIPVLCPGFPPGFCGRQHAWG
jgi:hypothetical protein